MAWHKSTRQERGYGRAWDITRLRILARDQYLCQCRHCKAEGRTALASEVDHVMSKAECKRRGWTVEQIDADSNLAAINHDCHKRKTIEDQGGTMRERVEIGLDGWPIG